MELSNFHDLVGEKRATLSWIFRGMVESSVGVTCPSILFCISSGKAFKTIIAYGSGGVRDEKDRMSSQ
jgi:hypothetical protein